MKPITKATVEQGVVTNEGFSHYSAKASALDIAVGEFPDTISTDLGTGENFVRISLDPEGAKYMQVGSPTTLTITDDVTPPWEPEQAPEVDVEAEEPAA